MWCRAEPPRKYAWEREQRRPTAKEYLGFLRRYDLKIVAEDAVDKRIIPRGKASRVCAEYRRFLALHLANPRECIPAGGYVDAFWHHHLLFTANYMSMCSAAKSAYIHHRPEILDRGKRVYASQDTCDELYRAAFERERPRDIWT